MKRLLIGVVVTAIASSWASAQFVQQGDKLVGSGAAQGVMQGESIALSADGNTAIVGGPGDNDDTGAAWVFIRSGGAWTQQGEKLVGTGAVRSDYGIRQGTAVALSADGNTAIVGGPYDNGGQGAAWVFTRSGGVWTQQGEKLVGTSAGDDSRQGWSVALSADGNTAIVGGPNAYDYDKGVIGAAWVFTRSGGVWTQLGSELVGTGVVGSAGQGHSVALSADGTTAIVGGPVDNGRIGAAWVFSRSGGVWTQQGEKLVGTGAMGNDEQGTSVALSADGNTAIVGGPGYSGAAWVFTRSGGVWTQQGDKLVGTGAVGSALQGASVGLSADGNTAILGGPWDNGTGATWVFTRSGGVWTQQGEKLVGTGAAGCYSRQGHSVALSADGNTAIVGGPVDDSTSGAAWVFTRSDGVWTQLGSKLLGTGTVGNAYQATSVALSADGATAIVGGPTRGSPLHAGAAWVFTRSGGVWTQQGDKLVGSGDGMSGGGWAVALSADGTTAIVGDPLLNTCPGGPIEFPTYTGAAWVFTRSGGVWTQQGEKLVGSGGEVSGQGWSVALSADGNTALVGGPYDNLQVGAAWVYARSGGVWTQQGEKLVGAGAVGNAQQGSSVALSADGNTAIVGGPADNSNSGAAWVFTRSDGVWTQQGEKLVGTGAGGDSRQGSSVALSADGTTAIVGGPNDNGETGAAWVFTRSGGVWTQQGEKLVGTGDVAPAAQGVSVALSADGTTAIVGGPADNKNSGAAWVFTRLGGVWTQFGNKLVGTGQVRSAGQGHSVTLSADGTTAIVGGPYDNGGQGAAWVFTCRSRDLWVPVVAHNRGLRESQWRSDLGLLNAGTWTANVQLTFHGTGGLVTNTTYVPPGTQSILVDVVGQLGVNAQGALEVFSDQPLVVSSRTYNQVSSGASCHANGTQGQDYPTLTASDGLSAGQRAYLAGLTENASYRANIGLVNTGPTAAVVTVELYDGTGTTLADYTVSLAPGQWAQETQPFRNKAGQTAMDRGYAKVTVTSGSGVVAFASVVDNITNDPTTITMASAESSQQGEALWVPVVAHNPGLQESQWRSDLGLLNAGTSTTNVQLAFHGTGGVVTTTTYVPPGAQSILVDVVGQLAADGQGALAVSTDQPLVVTSRTYNQVPSTASCYPNGTQGQDYPTLTAGDGLPAGQSAWLPHLTENSAYRTNIGLVNTGPNAAVVTGELYDGAGTKLTDYTVSLAPGQWAQETQPFRNKAGQTAMDRGYAKVTVTSGSGVVAFASVVDNITNDPTTITMQR